MKLAIQIPCLNEAETLPAVLADLPTSLPGIDSIEVIVLDDGSKDDTIRVAREHGVHHIVSSRTTMGLARTFQSGLDYSLHIGADVIVNTDGDNQYRGADIGKLVQPIVCGEADIVVGDRQTSTNDEFSPVKKLLQRTGSFVVRRLSGLQLNDAVSGFRAMSSDAAVRLNILSNFSYTTEMLIQAGQKRMAVVSVPIRTNPKTRESRLFGSAFEFVEKSAVTMVRSYARYRPLRTFCYLGAVFVVLGLIPLLRFIVFFIAGDGGGHLQSLVIGGAFLLLGALFGVAGLLADLIASNRMLLESILVNQRTARLDAMRGDEQYVAQSVEAEIPGTSHTATFDA